MHRKLPYRCARALFCLCFVARCCTWLCAGNYCPGGSTNPQPCPAGTYNSLTGKALVTDCVGCSAGKYSSSTGLSADCPNSCVAGYYCPTGSSAMIPCPSGVYGGLSNAGSLAGCGYVCVLHVLRMCSCLDVLCCGVAGPRRVPLAITVHKLQRHQRLAVLASTPQALV